MNYSASQKNMLVYIASMNKEDTPLTIIRKIMGITNIGVIEFVDKEKKVLFYTSVTGDSMLAQNFIQCLVILDKLEKDNLIFVEKGFTNDECRNYIGVNSSIIPCNEIENKIHNEIEQKYSFQKGEYCYHENGITYKFNLCCTRQTNSYELIKKYVNTIVYPTPELIEFVENGFKTPEQVRFEEQLIKERVHHNRTIKWTKLTLITAFLNPLFVWILDKYHERIWGFISTIF